MAQAPRDRLDLITVADDGQKPSTSKDGREEHLRKSADARSFPSWRFGHHTRSSRPSSTTDSQLREEKIELPSVLRESIVEVKIIPPLTRMSMAEEMPDKLIRIMRKLDTIMLTNTASDDDGSPTPTPGKAKAKAD